MLEQLNSESRLGYQKKRKISQLSIDSPHSRRHSQYSPSSNSRRYDFHENFLNLPSYVNDHDIEKIKMESCSSMGYNGLMDCDSGTDADDENSKRGCPKPKLRYMCIDSKFTRSYLSNQENGISPNEGEKTTTNGGILLSSQVESLSSNCKLKALKKSSWNKKTECLRSSVEFGIMVFVFGLLCTDDKIRENLLLWWRELSYVFAILLILYVSYTCKILNHSDLSQSDVRLRRFAVSVIYDPASLLYPPFFSILVPLVVFKNQPQDLVANIMLAVASIPSELLPSLDGPGNLNTIHWILSLIPLFSKRTDRKYYNYSLENSRLNIESLVLLSPLHQSLCLTLAHVTSASLLPAELQLLSILLNSLLLHARSLQAIILKSFLWGGGIAIMVSCSHVLKWNVILSKTPKWRLRCNDKELSLDTYNLKINRKTFFRKEQEISKCLRGNNSISSDSKKLINFESQRCDSLQSISIKSLKNIEKKKALSFQSSQDRIIGLPLQNEFKSSESKKIETQPFPAVSIDMKRKFMSGTRKTKSFSSERSLQTLSSQQVIFRKWIYAVYIYSSILCIMVFGIKNYIEIFALSGNEPIGWALGYLFGDLQKFRKFVKEKGLQHWVLLPARTSIEPTELGCEGWFENLRFFYIGEANTRLILSCYWLAVLTINLKVILRFFPYFEVDTRRKLFHLTMVTILLPATFIDPIFTGLALSLILAIFLLLELIRSAQLPLLSKSLTKFLTPFVDKRDYKGPVVVSHIFLLIGSAIPLWLTLGSLPIWSPTNLNSLNIETRELSMVSGVICVGVGDAAASLIGRRYGRRKWIWGDSKSLEGSAAFVASVSLGLLISKSWLKIGGWRVKNNDSLILTTLKSVIAASVAGLSEAVITAGNDNVIVPVIFWLCVKGLQI